MTLTITQFRKVPMLKLSGDVGCITDLVGAGQIGDRFVVELNDGTRLSGTLGGGFDPPPAGSLPVDLHDYHAPSGPHADKSIVRGIAVIRRRIRWARAAAPHAIHHADKLSLPSVANDDWFDPS